MKLSIPSLIAILAPYGAFGRVIPGLLGKRAHESCRTSVRSCASRSAGDTCCTNYPGGQFLQTQFWDTDPVTGPTTSWTIHGLWPDRCDGTFDSSCDTSRAYTGISRLLTNAGESSTLSYMNTYWVSDSESNEAFWEHEWSRHGTCVSTLNPNCYENYERGDEAVDYFVQAVALFRTLPTYTWLAAAGIVPSTTARYTLAQLQAVARAQHGQQATWQCNGNVLYQVYWEFNSIGPLSNPTWAAASPVDTSSCPSTGISYPPKSRRMLEN